MIQRNLEAEYEPNEYILIKSPKTVKRKIETIKIDGPSKLSIISDYDDTLIRSTYQKQMAFNSFRTLEDASVIGPELFERLNKARAMYRPLEDDHTISFEEKMKHMTDWRKLTLNSFIEKKLTKERIKQATMEGKLYFRFGTSDLFKTLINAKLKMHIVSGGIKGVVTESLEILEAQNAFKLGDSIIYTMTPDIYDNNGLLVEFGEPVILTGNKEQFVDHKLCPDIHEGNNMIFMGDLVEDTRVVKNLKLKTVVGIGFIRAREDYSEEQIKCFMDSYDIIIGNDGNMVQVNEILRYVLGMELSPDYSKYAKDEIVKLLN